MIPTIVAISWTTLRRDRVALALTFLLPIAFFSVFALVFGGMDRGAGRDIDVALVVEEDTPPAALMRQVLMRGRGLRVVTANAHARPLSRSEAVNWVQSGQVEVAIVVPNGFSARFLTRQQAPPEVLLYTNAANPLAAPVAEGLLQAAAFETAIQSMARLSGQSSVVQSEGLVRVRVESTLESEGKRPSVAFFAAGIGVMFLLFAVSGRSAILIEERESGVLTRLLSSQMTMGQFLLGRWLFLLLLGFAQVAIMFLWAALAFDLDLWTPRHLLGFVVMTLVTAAAAAGLGLLLASACRSRAQLNGVSSVLILVMSAVGGSMFPRFLMPESLQKLGLLTFNAWALDGYHKVFWFEADLAELLPEVLVLLVATGLFLGSARILASRWQRI